MAVERFSLRTGADERMRLDALLGAWLPDALGRPLSKSAVRRLVMAGAILVDGRPVRRPGLELRAGQNVEARVDRSRLLDRGAPAVMAEGGAGRAEHARLVTLFEDRWLLAVAKPAGLQVHASADASRPDLFSLVRARLSAARRDPESYLALHHRLDIGTSGVVLFAIDAAANAGLARAFGDHRAEKIYEAIAGRPSDAPAARWVARGPLALTGTGRAARVRVVPDGQPAETAFTIARRFAAALLIEARPATGRKHQVRAHLAEAGLPILGDVRYGGASSAAGMRVPRVMLHAAALRLEHPVTGARLDIRCPRPDDFQLLLDRLNRPDAKRRRGPRGSLDSPRASR